MKDIELFNDHFQNYKTYGIPKAQLIIADIPYNIGKDAYGSNPSWYIGGDNANGESELAGKTFFDTDNNFRISEFLHFCSKMLIKEPKEYGLNRYINLVFRKNFSAQVLKANMRIVGNCEYGVLLYREKLPKFNNDGRMIFNCMEMQRDTRTPKVHPTQKPVSLLEKLIEIFTDPGDVVIDPCAGSGTTLLAAANCGRKAYGFEIKKDFYKSATNIVLPCVQRKLF